MNELHVIIEQAKNWLARKKRQFGFALIKKGVGLAFYQKDPYSLIRRERLDDEVLKALKDEANRSTLLGSQIETGNHAHGVMQPISHYTAISIAHALRNMPDAMLKDSASRVTTCDEKYRGYLEHWKY